MPISHRVLQDVQESISRNSIRQEIVDRVLERLPRLEEAHNDPTAIRQAWDDIVGDLTTLVQDKILDQKLFDMLAEEVVTSTVITKEELEEFRKAANIAFTLRALALNPRRVLPPGKSLLSLFMNQPDEKTEAERKREEMVADVVKKAFWDAAFEQLSSSLPEVQIPRIKAFYHDLYVALKPFFPPKHPLLVALTSPLSPSSNPLASALNYLRASLALMRTVCAPVRDEEIDAAIALLDSADKLHTSMEELAKMYVNGLKFALAMGETMVEDYQGFMVKYGDESNVAAMLRGSAREQEREVILSAFGENDVKSSWENWKKNSSAGVWTDRLVDIASSLDPLMATPSILPPILKMSRVDLAEAQTLLLGLVIAASIRTLVPPLSSTRQAALYQGNREALEIEAKFIERLWAVIGADPFTKTETTQQSDLDNMAVEVVRLWKQRNPATMDLQKEQELSDMVKRMVNDETHPVRVLLKKRVTDSLKERLAGPIIPLNSGTPHSVATGRVLRPLARLKPGKEFAGDQAEVDLSIPGFGDSVLKLHLRDILHIFRVVQKWVEYTWNDIL
ncbi:hypothetical protein CPB86DRAFT_725557 [Serendipita vermifera]|nr:hypothetical protein CPB86DRAFT_725557 [Serendipita vermifera]